MLILTCEFFRVSTSDRSQQENHIKSSKKLSLIITDSKAVHCSILEWDKPNGCQSSTKRSHPRMSSVKIVTHHRTYMVNYCLLVAHRREFFPHQKQSIYSKPASSAFCVFWTSQLDFVKKRWFLDSSDTRTTRCFRNSQSIQNASNLV